MRGARKRARSLGPERMVGRVRLVLDSGCVLREASEGGRAVRLSAAAAFDAGLLKEEHVARLETIISQLRARLPLPAAGGSGHKRKAPEPAEVQACRAIRPLVPMSATRQKLPCGILPPRSSNRFTCCSSLAVLSCPAAARASAGLRRLTAGLRWPGRPGWRDQTAVPRLPVQWHRRHASSLAPALSLAPRP